MKYWLIKSEPSVYPWEQLEKDGKATWDGVRNYRARNNLREMKKGDQLFFYHSNEGLEIVGIAQISKEHFQDPTTEETAWLAVEIKPYKKLKKPVSLAYIKTDKKLANMELVKIARLSVSEVSEAEYNHICKLGGI
jgi:predicted RNA-binding protein with PUA-like domain